MADIEQARREAKSTCPSCGARTRKDIMREEGVNYSIRKCTKCRWWGS